MEISRELAIRILKYCHEHRKDFYFPFQVVCKEYRMEDKHPNEDFDVVEPENWETINNDKIFQTFELWENLQNLYSKTVRLMAKGFLDQILTDDVKLKEYIFYTVKKTTPKLKLHAGFNIENCEILGFANGYSSKKAFESLKAEYFWLHELNFNKVTASELKSEKIFQFSFI